MIPHSLIPPDPSKLIQFPVQVFQQAVTFSQQMLNLVTTFVLGIFKLMA
jgi:hypothetical protein